MLFTISDLVSFDPDGVLVLLNGGVPGGVKEGECLPVLSGGFFNICPFTIINITRSIVIFVIVLHCEVIVFGVHGDPYDGVKRLKLSGRSWRT